MKEEKKCTKCKQNKFIDNFNIDNNRHDGYFPWCKLCVSIGTKKYRENNKEKVAEGKKHHYIRNRNHYVAYNKQYRKDNSESIKKQRETYTLAHKEEKAAYDKKYNKKNKDLIAAYNRAYEKKNKEKIRIRRRAYLQNNQEKKNAKNAEYRTNKLQRIPSWANLTAIKEIYIDCSEINLAAKLAGCTEKFVVDHIIPLQAKRVSGLHVENNLQIITNYENCSKNNKFDPLRGI